MVASIKEKLKHRNVQMFVLMMALLFAPVSPASHLGRFLAPLGPAVTYAQTPVPIVIDTNEIFTQTNIWIDVFIPIMAIGIGIAVALAILTFIGNQILRAFKGGGR